MSNLTRVYDSSSERNSFSSMGFVLALVLSWATNHSVLWAILHTIFGWFYVVYWGFEYGGLAALVKRLMI